MQAIMLAAGMGKRLQKYTQGQTKCMLNVAGKTLLEYACDALKAAGVNKLILVVGYQSDKLIKYALDTIKDMDFEFVYNVDYEKTNNIYSLYLARNYLQKDDTILLESDLIYDSSIIRDLVEDANANLAVVSKYEYWMDGTVCKLDKDGNIEEFVEKKDFDFDNVSQYYKTVNIYKFSKEFATYKYIPFLEAYINVYGKNQYYESVLKIISHINKLDLKAFDIGEKKWYEIDNSHDYDIAETMFQRKEKRLLSYELHYGGYWRFPKIYDYCYLVNPYFPTKQLKTQLKYMFDNLLTQYPSGMKVQKISACRIFNVNEENILVGNGAAELINVVGRIFNGVVGVPSPIFNEYLRCFEKNEKIFIVSDNDDFAVDKDKILRVLDKIQLLVLVNPDNPSGAFLPYADMIEIIESCKKHNVMCLVDESFVDFADASARYTLVEQKILDRFPNLVVIKSISKSYGIPGIRLGILATSDIAFLKQIESNLAIWNINSFAEYFLEIFPLYKRNYILACNQLGEERERFAKGLRDITYLKVYPSQANYILCRVTDIKSRELANLMLENYDILIKDLSTKTGFDGKQYIRIAIKSKEENDFLLEALRKIGETI